jgi:hypothetical protein
VGFHPPTTLVHVTKIPRANFCTLFWVFILADPTAVLDTNSCLNYFRIFLFQPHLWCLAVYCLLGLQSVSDAYWFQGVRSCHFSVNNPPNSSQLTRVKNQSFHSGH